MRLLFFILFTSILFANSPSQEEKLQIISKQRNLIGEKLKLLGNDINANNKKIKQLDKEIESLESDINANQKLYLEQEETYNSYLSMQKELINKQNILQKELIDSLLRDMTIVMMLNSPEALSEDSIINEEILKKMSTIAKNKVNQLTINYEKLNKDILSTQTKINSSKKVILLKKQKVDNLKLAKLEQQNLSNKIKIQIDSYNKELVRLDKERKDVESILVNLNILKNRPKPSLTPPPKSGIQAPIEVRQIASSYRPVNTTKYSGTKTIAPLKDYKIASKYGQYIDPVYNMKVFNEFITFSVDKNSSVLSVLDGKIVFAKDTAFAKKMVIIEHKNGIHTIYSYLDSIPSYIKVGNAIKKGDVLAYVNDKLNFEVTQKDKHINPSDLIKIK